MKQHIDMQSVPTSKKTSMVLSIVEKLTHRQTTMIIKYNHFSFTAGYGAALSTIINKTEIQTNIKISHFLSNTQ